MSKIFRQHAEYYITLLFILIFAVFLLLHGQSSKTLSFFIAVILTCSYIIWGILHHFLHHGVSIRVMLEYFLIGVIGFLLMALILQTTL